MSYRIRGTIAPDTDIIKSTEPKEQENLLLNYLEDKRTLEDYEVENSMSIVLNGGFAAPEDLNDTNFIVPLKEICLYVACHIVKDNHSNVMFEIPEELHTQVEKHVPKIISNAIKSLSLSITNYEPEDYDNKILRHYLKEYSDNFIGVSAVKSQRNIKTYHEAKVVYMMITKWKKYLKDNHITKERLIKKSTNNTRGYKAQTVTELKKIIREDISQHLNNSKRISRIISRATEVIIT